MKRNLFIILAFILLLISSMAVFAENSPATHTYLTSVSDNGTYTFETIVTPTDATSALAYKNMYIPIVAMYDSKNALCGLAIGKPSIIKTGTNGAFTLSITTQKTPNTIKTMLWSGNGRPIPTSQFELVPNVVCDKEFGSLAQVNLINIKSRVYTFEAFLTSPTDASYSPVIRMYDASGNLCGYYKGENITLSAGKYQLKEFTVTSSATPAKICFTLRNGTDVAQFSTINPTLSTEKFGMIMGADSSKGVKIYSTDGVYQYYDFADNFILSYGNNIIPQKIAAYNYLNALRLKSYKRIADKDTDGDGKADNWNMNYDWLLFFDQDGNDARYSQIVRASTNPSSKYYNYLKDDYRYKYSDFLNNYGKRMVRVLISPEGKIVSMAFAGDSFFKKFTPGVAYSEVFYNKPVTTFSDKLVVKSNAKILYLPTKGDVTENDFKAFSASELKDGNSYHVKGYTTTKGEQVVLVTHMLSDQEVATLNTKTVKNINIALNGNGGTAVGIKNHAFNISINTQSSAINDKANKLANTAMSNVAKGLEGALKDAEAGYCITKDYISIKYSTEISAAKASINEIQAMDTQYNTSYYNNLKNELLDTVEANALEFLEDTFIN